MRWWKGSLIVALMGLSLLLSGVTELGPQLKPSPQPVPDGTVKASPSPQGQNTKSEGEKGSASNPITTKVTSAEQQKPQHITDDNEHKTIHVVISKDASDYIFALFSALLVISAFLQVRYYRLTAIADRPHLALGLFEAHDVEISKLPFIRFHFKNYGKSPAFITEYYARFRATTYDLPKSPEYGEPIRLPFGVILGANELGGLEQRTLEEGILQDPMIKSVHDKKTPALVLWLRSIPRSHRSLVSGRSRN